ncbi:hypothetical protein niasHT_006546 [Heterodera trifolii]|uniref:G protein-coupled receptor n=1 Tax=Heterodera trifolii TaxID=157864 RepID=A0ABD2LYL4_9BILA
MDQTSNNCDHPTDSSQNLMAAIFLGVHLAGLIPHLCVFPATFQLAKKLSAFMLLLTINVMHFLLLLWGVYFYGQYFIGHRIRLTSLDLDAFVFQTAHLTSMALYVFLAFNRAVAIIFPLKYDIVFSIRFLAIFTSTANSPPPAANNAIDHLMRERTRLYLICLLGTLPPFILLLLPITQQMLGIQLDFRIPSTTNGGTSFVGIRHAWT